MERVFPEALAYDVLDTLAYYKMTPEVRSLMKRFDPKDGMVLMGSDLELRLKLLAIDDKLDRVLARQDSSEPSKGFEELLDLVDVLHQFLGKTEKAGESNKAGWLVMKNAIVRQAALAHIRAQESVQSRNWDTISIEDYMDTIERLLPDMDVDMDSLEDDEQLQIISAQKQRHTLEDIFECKGTAVSSLKIRSLLHEYSLETFKKQLKEFTYTLDRALLSEPKLVQNHANMFMADVDELAEVHVESSVNVGAHSIDDVSSPPRQKAKKTSDAQSPASSPATIHSRSATRERSVKQHEVELTESNGALQEDLARRPGTVATALAVEERLPPARQRRKSADGGAGSGSGSGAAAGSKRNRSGGPAALLSSEGEQVDFDDSQDLDEPEPEARPGLRGKEVPAQQPRLNSRSPPRESRETKGRVPWTKEEESELHAAVAQYGKGKWALALKKYKFQKCRSSVDLKDKWRNIVKKQGQDD